MGLGRVAAAACSVLLLLGLLTTPAAAQTAAIEVRQIGWTAGAMIPGAWNPVNVRVTGTPETEGRGPARVQVSLRTNPRTPVFASYGQEVALPAGVAKDVTVWVPATVDTTYTATIQVIDGGGRILAEEAAATRQFGNSSVVIATLAESPSLAATLGRIEVPYQQGLTQRLPTVTLNPADIPPNAEYLLGLSALIVQGGAAQTLTQEQQQAIRGWVARGGHLVLTGGPAASQTAAQLIGADGPRVRFGRLESGVDLQPLTAWANATAPLEPGTATRIEGEQGERLAGSAEVPLAWRTAWGSGTLTLLAVDPTLDPLRNSPATTRLLMRTLEPAMTMLEPDTVSGQRLPRTSVNNDYALRLAAALEVLPTNAFPSWSVIGLVLALFTLFAGPILHVVLWRTDRRPWLWFAVPSLAVLVTIGLYVFGVGLPGRDLLTNVVSYVRVDPHTGQAQQSVAMSFVAPIREQLTARIAGAVPLRIGAARLMDGYQYGGSYGGGYIQPATPSELSSSGYEVVTGRDTRIDFRSNLGAARSVVFERGLIEPIGTLETDVQVIGREPRLTGSVRNATPYPMHNVALVFGQIVLKLGDLEPGQSVPVEADAQHMQAPTTPNYFSLGYRLFGTPPTQQSRQLSGSDQLMPPTEPEPVRRMRVVDAVIAPLPGGSGVGPGTPRGMTMSPTVLAFTTAALPGTEMPSAGEGRVLHLALIAEPFELGVAHGPFAIPPALLETNVATEPGAMLFMAGGSPSSQVLELRGTATYTFRAHLPPGAVVDSLAVRMQQSPPQTAPAASFSGSGRSIALGPSTPDAFRIFNWQSGRFESLPAGQTRAQLSPATSYAGPDGSVKLQVTSGDANSFIRFAPPELTLEGQNG